MIERTSYSLSTSLVLARLGQAAVKPLSERSFLERLHVSAAEAGCMSADTVTAIYVGLKVHLPICVYGATRHRTLALFEALMTTIVGTDNDQTLHLRTPGTDDSMSQRYAAVRLNEFICNVVEPSAQGKAWFLLIDAPGEADAMLRWVMDEITTTLQLCHYPSRMFPPNLFVLVAAETPPSRLEQDWLSLPAPVWCAAAPKTPALALPPVGYQRLLLDYQIAVPTSPVSHTSADRNARAVACADLRQRWLAASIDAQQRGLWVRDDLVANTRRALAVLSGRRS